MTVKVPPLLRLAIVRGQERYFILAIFAIGLAARLIPELVAFPYPIGYDVVNYYIPVLTDFNKHFDDVFSGQFPLYVLLLLAVNYVVKNPQITVASAAVASYGFFALSIFYLSRTVFRQNMFSSMILATFVIFQISSLRTTWDLHRDIFALTLMFFSITAMQKSIDAKTGLSRRRSIVLLSCIVALTVSADKMVGALFALALSIAALACRRRTGIIVFAAIIAVLVASFSFVLADKEYGQAESKGVLGLVEPPPLKSSNNEGYNQVNLAILFAVFCGYLLPFGIYGFVHANKNILIKILLVITIAGSLSWLVLPDYNVLAANRWIILSGILLSIFAGHALLLLTKRIQARHTKKLAEVILGAVIMGSVLAGIAYATFPYERPLVFLNSVRSNIEYFGPVTMQFNSLDAKDTGKMISFIESINTQTEHNAIIVGEKHWRGFMNIYLKDGRTYRFSNDPVKLSESIAERINGPVYLFYFDGEGNNNNDNNQQYYRLKRIDS